MCVVFCLFFLEGGMGVDLFVVFFVIKQNCFNSSKNMSSTKQIKMDWLVGMQ